ANAPDRWPATVRSARIDRPRSALIYAILQTRDLACGRIRAFSTVAVCVENSMLTIYNCIVTEHDLRLVGLAAVICALASFTAISLLHHVRRSTGHMRLVWLFVSATSTGFGIWATHFIAMLAFAPGLPSAYNIALTFLSLIAAILLTGAGLAVAVISIR